ncbi:hypothetical protein [Persicobacter sp. CCB-QB2]|uniref:hypothetical protein n=1 Tax=Persicobacter sp. CCB-QB2 TaxID=1561025 RepID=UPI0006A959D0|nr:hypothetical protein [Persicobacter sp. CCB-QB2]
MDFRGFTGFFLNALGLEVNISAGKASKPLRLFRKYVNGSAFSRWDLVETILRATDWMYWERGCLVESRLEWGGFVSERDQR